MAYSYINYVSDGVNKNYSIPFGYIDKGNIDVYVNGVLTSAYTWNNASVITLDTAPAAGVPIQIKRNSSIEERLVDYQDGSTLTEEILDLDSKQAFYLAQETLDRAESVMNLDVSNNWDAQGKRIKNVGNPIDGQDAVTVDWLSNNFPFVEDVNVQYVKQTFNPAVGTHFFTLTEPYIVNSKTLQVFRNGIKLDETLYAEIDANTVVLSNATALNDVIEFLYIKRLTLVNSDVIDFMGRNVTEKLEEQISVKDYGAIGDGVANDTVAIQDAIDTGKMVFFPAGTYNITSPITMKVNGQKIYGEGKLRTFIKNVTNANKLLIIGDTGTNPNECGECCSVSDMSFYGNALTTEGISILGLVDDPVTLTARDVNLSNVYIRDVGAGYALRISSWECNTYGVSIWYCNKGVLLGSASNSTTMVSTYISRCTNEAFEIKNTAGIPSNINIIGLTAQYSGGTNGSVVIEDGNSIQFSGLYIEGNDAPNNVYISSAAKNVAIINGMHNKVDGTCLRIIYANNVKCLNVHNFSHIGGSVESIVKIEGTLPLTTCSGLFDAVSGLTIGLIDDQSTRKATIHTDPLQGTYGVSTFNALTSQENIKLADSATGNVHLSFINGRVVFGTGSAPNIRKSGSSVEFYSDNASTLANIRVGSAILGSGSVKILSGANSPEGAFSADVGSIYLRTNGGAGTTFYVKESGTGNTGWVAK